MHVKSHFLNNNNEMASFAFLPSVGTLVDVENRTWPGINKQGGIARITAVYHADSTSPSHPYPHISGAVTSVDVKYILEGRTERKLDIAWIKPYMDYADHGTNDGGNDGTAVRQSGRSRSNRAASTPNPPRSSASDQAEENLATHASRRKRPKSLSSGTTTTATSMENHEEVEKTLDGLQTCATVTSGSTGRKKQKRNNTHSTKPLSSTKKRSETPDASPSTAAAFETLKKQQENNTGKPLSSRRKGLATITAAQSKTSAKTIAAREMSRSVYSTMEKENYNADVVTPWSVAAKKGDTSLTAMKPKSSTKIPLKLTSKPTESKIDYEEVAKGDKAQVTTSMFTKTNTVSSSLLNKQPMAACLSDENEKPSSRTDEDASADANVRTHISRQSALRDTTDSSTSFSILVSKSKPTEEEIASTNAATARTMPALGREFTKKKLADDISDSSLSPDATAIGKNKQAHVVSSPFSFANPANYNGNKKKGTNTGNQAQDSSSSNTTSSPSANSKKRSNPIKNKALGKSQELASQRPISSYFASSSSSSEDGIAQPKTTTKKTFKLTRGEKITQLYDTGSSIKNTSSSDNTATKVHASTTALEKFHMKIAPIAAAFVQEIVGPCTTTSAQQVPTLDSRPHGEHFVQRLNSDDISEAQLGIDTTKIETSRFAEFVKYFSMVTRVKGIDSITLDVLLPNINNIVNQQQTEKLTNKRMFTDDEVRLYLRQMDNENRLMWAQDETVYLF